MLLAKYRLNHPSLITDRFIKNFKKSYDKMSATKQDYTEYEIRKIMNYCENAAKRTTIAVPNGNFAKLFVLPVIGFAVGVAACLTNQFGIGIGAIIASTTPIVTLQHSYVAGDDIVMLSKDIEVKNKFFKGLAERKYEKVEKVYDAITEKPTIVQDATSVQTPINKEY